MVLNLTTGIGFLQTREDEGFQDSTRLLFRRRPTGLALRATLTRRDGGAPASHRGRGLGQIKQKKLATCVSRSGEPQLALFTDARAIAFVQDISIEIEVTSHDLDPRLPTGKQHTSYGFSGGEFRYVQSRVLIDDCCLLPFACLRSRE